MTTTNIDTFLKEEGSTAVTLSLYVQPGASKSEWSGRYGEHLKLRIKALPVEGQANKEVIAFLAQFFELSKSQVELLKGQSGRLKKLKLHLSKTEALDKLKPFFTA
ncbi:MAG: DUF167 domain-containing protein [Bdellovibrionaceae bacterium]|nr:DUF167 domain-containing protein [Pseudobdellovibrionaceae bacterium]